MYNSIGNITTSIGFKNSQSKIIILFICIDDEYNF